MSKKTWRSGPQDTDPDADAPYYEYSASLTTTAERLEQDLGLFRAILNGIQIYKP